MVTLQPLTAGATGPFTALLTWTRASDNIGISNYLIYENSNLLTTVPGNLNAYNVTGLCGSTTYTFKVEASDSTSSTTDGPSATVTTLYHRPDFTVTLSTSVQPIEAGWTYNVDSATVTSNCGFSGNVDLLVSTEPTVPKGPMGIPIDPHLQIPAGGSATSVIAISTDQSTPVGNYTLTVTATTGSLGTSASMTVMVTPAREPPPSPPPSPPPQTGEARLLYQGFPGGAFHNGQTGVITNKFTNQGAVPVKVSSLTITGDLGTFTQTQGLPLFLNVTTSITLNMTIKVPTFALPGNHNMTVTVGWQYYNPYIPAWQTGSNIVTKATLRVQGPNLVQYAATLATMLRSHEGELLRGLVVYVSIVAAAAVVVIRHENLSRNRRRQSARVSL